MNDIRALKKKSSFFCSKLCSPSKIIDEDQNSKMDVEDNEEINLLPQSREKAMEHDFAKTANFG